jgi:hypothetical protein
MKVTYNTGDWDHVSVSLVSQMWLKSQRWRSSQQWRMSQQWQSSRMWLRSQLWRVTEITTMMCDWDHNYDMWLRSQLWRVTEITTMMCDRDHNHDVWLRSQSVTEIITVTKITTVRFSAVLTMCSARSITPARASPTSSTSRSRTSPGETTASDSRCTIPRRRATPHECAISAVQHTVQCITTQGCFTVQLWIAIHHCTVSSPYN